MNSKVVEVYTLSRSFNRVLHRFPNLFPALLWHSGGAWHTSNRTPCLRLVQENQKQQRKNKRNLEHRWIFLYFPSPRALYDLENRGLLYASHIFVVAAILVMLVVSCISGFCVALPSSRSPPRGGFLSGSDNNPKPKISDFCILPFFSFVC